jgi:hypothetical protein
LVGCGWLKCSCRGGSSVVCWSAFIVVLSLETSNHIYFKLMQIHKHKSMSTVQRCNIQIPK